mmetsp:Transcript_16003/g.37940  ORF Transcript_16003/g.37940 Transcript_16003/m.37940 type:complete len:480 (+) Transcript_16003:822-2261(+)
MCRPGGHPPGHPTHRPRSAAGSTPGSPRACRGVASAPGEPQSLRRSQSGRSCGPQRNHTTCMLSTASPRWTPALRGCGLPKTISGERPPSPGSRQPSTTGRGPGPRPCSPRCRATRGTRCPRAGALARRTALPAEAEQASTSCRSRRRAPHSLGARSACTQRPRLRCRSATRPPPPSQGSRRPDGRSPLSLGTQATARRREAAGSHLAGRPWTWARARSTSPLARFRPATRTRGAPPGATRGCRPRGAARGIGTAPRPTTWEDGMQIPWMDSKGRAGSCFSAPAARNPGPARPMRVARAQGAAPWRQARRPGSRQTPAGGARWCSPCRARPLSSPPGPSRRRRPQRRCTTCSKGGTPDRRRPLPTSRDIPQAHATTPLSKGEAPSRGPPPPPNHASPRRSSARHTRRRQRPRARRGRFLIRAGCGSPSGVRHQPQCRRRPCGLIRAAPRGSPAARRRRWGLRAAHGLSRGRARCRRWSR